jgi:DNA-binding transcriptional MerR regulator
MWLAELSERSGVPIPTIKYYRREGLLPPGEAAGATRSRYDEGHLDRLRLIRALVTVAGLPLERVREVLAAVEDDSVPLAEAMGSAHLQLSPPPVAAPSRQARDRVAALARGSRWRVAPEGPHGTALAAALDAMAAAGVGMSDDTLATYADAAVAVARVDVASTSSLGREGAVARAVTGTVLGEQVLLALRRLSHEATSRGRARS